MEKQKVEEASHYLQDFFEITKLSFGNVLFRFVFVFLVLCVLAALLVISLSFFFYGIATYAGEVLGKPWLGYLSVSLFILLALSGAWVMRLKKNQRKIARLKKTFSTADFSEWVQKYPWIATSIAATTGFIVSTQMYTAEPNDKEQSPAPSFLIPFGTMILSLLEKLLIPFIVEACSLQTTAPEENDTELKTPVGVGG